MVFRRRIQRRPVRRRGKRNGRRNNAFKAQMSNAPINPRASVQSPWNSVVVQRTINVANTSAFSLTSGYIRDVLFDQLAIPAAVTTVDLKLQSIVFYDLGGRPIEAKIHDYSSSDNSVVGTMLSFPGRNGWSRARLSWPKAISCTPLSAGASSTAIVATGAVGTPYGSSVVTNATVLTHINVLWRINNNATPSLLKRHDSIAHSGKIIASPAINVSTQIGLSPDIEVEIVSLAGPSKPGKSIQKNTPSGASNFVSRLESMDI